MKIKTICFAAKQKVEIRDADLSDTLTDGQVLIETAVSMISPGTELAALAGTHSKSNLANRPAWLSYPSVPGYLATGSVIKTGAKVAKYRKGDRVVCEGAGVWNSHASHIIMDENSHTLVPIAPGVEFKEAVFTKLGSIAMTAIRVCKPEFGDLVAVMGLGLVGQVAARLAALAGAGKVVGIDPLESRRALLKGLSGIETANPANECLKKPEKINSSFPGFDHIIEASGNAKAFLQACEMARIKGKIAVLSSPHTFFEIRLYDHIHSKGLQVLGAHGFVLANPANASDAWTDGSQRLFFMQLLAEQRIDVRPLVSHQIPADKAPETYEGLLRDPGAYMGVQFIWNQ